MKKSVKNLSEIPYQLKLKTDYAKLLNDLATRKNDLLDIDEKIKTRQSYCSREQMLIWRRQRKAVYSSIKEISIKIDLHPLHKI